MRRVAGRQKKSRFRERAHRSLFFYENKGSVRQHSYISN